MSAAFRPNVAAAQARIKAVVEAPAVPGQELRKIHNTMTMQGGIMQPLLVPPYVDEVQGRETVPVRFTLDEMKTADPGLTHGLATKIRDYVLSPEARDRDPYGELLEIRYDRGFVINDDLSEGIKDSYTAKDIVDGNVPIYFVVHTERPQHLSLMVHYAGKAYSIGLGFNGRKAPLCSIPGSEEYLSKACFYSPDFLIHPCGITSKGVAHAYRLVDFGAFTRTHADRILAIRVDTSSPLPIDMETRAVYIPLVAKYSKVSNKFLADVNYLNCTSFLSYVFAERIDCSKLGVDMPWKCESLVKSKMGDMSMNDMFNKFIQEYRSRVGTPEMKEFLEYKYSSITTKVLVVAGAVALAAAAYYMKNHFFNTDAPPGAMGGRYTRKNRSYRKQTRRNRRN